MYFLFSPYARKTRDEKCVIQKMIHTWPFVLCEPSAGKSHSQLDRSLKSLFWSAARSSRRLLWLYFTQTLYFPWHSRRRQACIASAHHRTQKIWFFVRARARGEGRKRSRFIYLRCGAGSGRRYANASNSLG
jgi:hypothetical protein